MMGLGGSFGRKDLEMICDFRLGIVVDFSTAA